MKLITKSLLSFIFLSIATYIVIKGTKSSKAFDKTLENGLNVIKKYAKLEEIDLGEYKKITIMKVLPFYTKAYNIENLGYLSIFYGKFGAMQLFCFLFSPFEKDFPILTIDYIYILKKRQALLETYNATLSEDNDAYKSFVSEFEKLKEVYSELKDWVMSPKWEDERIVVNMRKEGNDSQEDKFTSLFEDVINTYFKNIIKMPQLSEDEKKKKNQLIKEFSDLLVKNGGVVINFLKTSLKQDVLNKLFGEVFFGYETH